MNLCIQTRVNWAGKIFNLEERRELALSNDNGRIALQQLIDFYKHAFLNIYRSIHKEKEGKSVHGLSGRPRKENDIEISKLAQKIHGNKKKGESSILSELHKLLVILARYIDKANVCNNLMAKIRR